MNETQQGSFEGWAILEIFGHQRYAGYVTTQVFGTSSLFRLDVPELKERDRITKRGCYTNSDGGADIGPNSIWAPPGATVREAAVAGYTKFFGVGAIYAMTPCTEDACLKAVEEIQPRAVMLVSLPSDTKALGPVPAPAPVRPFPGDYSCCDGNPEDGHNLGCPSYDEPETIQNDQRRN